MKWSNRTQISRKPLPRVRKPNLHPDRGQDSNPCAWRPYRPQSTHGSTAPRRPLCPQFPTLIYPSIHFSPQLLLLLRLLLLRLLIFH
ncbi:hypothetical protein E2C01_071080 [Portunus trituberculatus]|uniref:Uncharacterized protein n=1 Tax=Portunus trituberculatus TaxID=210409 RepID=A0A5B7I3X1_PORTR|nr:hypothetical protein [Portunus trituberculatus]